MRMQSLDLSRQETVLTCRGSKKEKSLVNLWFLVLLKVLLFQMEDRKTRRNHRQKPRRQKSDTESKGPTDMRRQIERISTVSGSNDQPQKFNKKEKKEIESPDARTAIRRIKNINLYDDDYYNDKRKSGSADLFAEEHEIIAAIRTMNAGVSYSNQRIERLWASGDRSSESSRSSVSGDCKENKAAFSSFDSDEDKYKNNVLMSSLLKQRKEQLKLERESDKTSNNCKAKDAIQKHNLSHIIRDLSDPDFYYRRTTVANQDADYTVEHVGRVNVVGARKYLIDSSNDDDFVFQRRNTRRSFQWQFE